MDVPCTPDIFLEISDKCFLLCQWWNTFLIKTIFSSCFVQLSSSHEMHQQGSGSGRRQCSGQPCPVFSYFGILVQEVAVFLWLTLVPWQQHLKRYPPFPLLRDLAVEIILTLHIVVSACLAPSYWCCELCMSIGFSKLSWGLDLLCLVPLLKSLTYFSQHL